MKEEQVQPWRKESAVDILEVGEEERGEELKRFLRRRALLVAYAWLSFTPLKEICWWILACESSIKDSWSLIQALFLQMGTEGLRDAATRHKSHNAAEAPAHCGTLPPHPVTKHNCKWLFPYLALTAQSNGTILYKAEGTGSGIIGLDWWGSDHQCPL